MVGETERSGHYLMGDPCLDRLFEDALVVFVRIEVEVVVPDEFGDRSLATVRIGLIDPDEIEAAIENHQWRNRVLEECLQGLGLLRQFAFHPLLLRDFVHHSLESQPLTGRILHDNRLVSEPYCTAVARSHPVLQHESLTGLSHFRNCRQHAGPILLVQAAGPEMRIFHVFRRREAQDRLDLRADVEGGSAAVECEEMGDGGNAFHQRPVFHLRFPVRPLGPYAGLDLFTKRIDGIRQFNGTTPNALLQFVVSFL